VKIALDAMGGDLAPKATVDGAVLAARDFGIEVVLVGDRALLEKELASCDAAGLPITIQHASEAVAMDEAPLESVLGKPNSSIHVGFELVKRGEVDGLVGAGNSGAMMAAAMVILGNLPGIDRPAIASLVPTSVDYALLIDAGANVEVKPTNLVEFAVMGSVYCKRVRKLPRPKVGLLSNGEEDSKGNELTRAAAATLREMAPHINYIGYVEGRDINRGNVDVIVTDGFTGNVALKTMEGFGAFVFGNLRELFGAGFRGRLAYLLVRKRLTALRARFDPSEYGGAPLLGVSGVAIIAHGSSNARAIRNAIRAAGNEALVRHVNTEIVETLRTIPAPAPAKPAGRGIRALFAKVRGRLHRHPKEPSEPAGKAAAQMPRGDSHPVETLESPRIDLDSLREGSPASAPSNGSAPAIGIAGEPGNDAGDAPSQPTGTPHPNPPGHVKH
jgi:phosphate acyltransferase